MKKYAQKRTVRVQKMGKWGFVPKVWVALLATLISISLFVSCENTAGGGSSKSSAGGRDASSNSKPNNYVFIDGSFKVASVLKVDEVSFADIKKNTSLDDDYIVGEHGFLGWYIQDDSTETLVKDSDLFSESTTFVAKIDANNSVPFVIYTFEDKDGSSLGTARLRGEVSFADIKKKAGNVLDSFKEGDAGFLGWVVKGGTTVVKDGDKYSSETTFVATYEKYRKIDVPDLCDGYVWYSEKDKTYVVFDDSMMGMGGLYSVLNKVTNSKEARDTMLDYALLQRAVENAENECRAKHPGVEQMGKIFNSDPDVQKAYKDLDDFEKNNFNNTGYNWWIVDATTFGMMTADFDTSMYSLHLDLSGKTVVNDAGDVLFTRI